DHARVVGSAILSAEQMIGARLGRLEPQVRVPARQDVSLDPEGRDVKVVDDVLGGHHELHGSAGGNVQGVDLSLPAGVLKMPHPLLAGDVNLKAVVRGAGDVEI